MSYARFFVMVITSMVAMFVLMYLNTFSIDHMFFSQTRAWMAVVMGAAMAILMLLVMWSNFDSRRANLTLLAVSICVFSAALWLVRSQVTVGDIAYMKAMIPHHSIAVLTSSRAQIRDLRVRVLADGILSTQVREIAEMRTLISELEKHPPGEDAPVLEAAPP